MRRFLLLLVLRDGQVIERGTHTSLLEARGFYYDLYMSQFRRTVEEDADAEDIDAFFVVGD
jgi:ABC-type transport system involved in cytochrome bd biosynthesis fused ATPase/permease subunit